MHNPFAARQPVERVLASADGAALPASASSRIESLASLGLVLAGFGMCIAFWGFTISGLALAIRHVASL